MHETTCRYRTFIARETELVPRSKTHLRVAILSTTTHKQICATRLPKAKSVYRILLSLANLTTHPRGYSEILNTKMSLRRHISLLWCFRSFLPVVRRCNRVRALSGASCYRKRYSNTLPRPRENRACVNWLHTRGGASAAEHQGDTVAHTNLKLKIVSDLLKPFVCTL